MLSVYFSLLIGYLNGLKHKRDYLNRNQTKVTPNELREKTNGYIWISISLSFKADSQAYEYVVQLLQEIPQEVMARASFNCNAFARALMHFENHLRIQNK